MLVTDRVRKQASPKLKRPGGGPLHSTPSGKLCHFIQVYLYGHVIGLLYAYFSSNL